MKIIAGILFSTLLVSCGLDKVSKSVSKAIGESVGKTVGQVVGCGFKTTLHLPVDLLASIASGGYDVEVPEILAHDIIKSFSDRNLKIEIDSFWENLAGPETARLNELMLDRYPVMSDTDFLELTKGIAHAFAYIAKTKKLDDGLVFRFEESGAVEYFSISFKDSPEKKIQISSCEGIVKNTAKVPEDFKLPSKITTIISCSNGNSEKFEIKGERDGQIAMIYETRNESGEILVEAAEMDVERGWFGTMSINHKNQNYEKFEVNIEEASGEEWTNEGMVIDSLDIVVRKVGEKNIKIKDLLCRNIKSLKI